MKQIGKDRQLDYDPCFISWFSKGEFLLAGGSNKQCNIYSRDGVQLGVVGDLPSWVWSAEVRPDANCVVSLFCSLINVVKIVQTSEKERTLKITLGRNCSCTKVLEIIMSIRRSEEGHPRRIEQ